MQDAAKRLEALSRYAILDTPPEPEFDDVVQIAQRVCETPVALVSLVAEDRQWFKARVGFDPCETPIGQSVCVYALAADDIFCIPDLTLDPRTRANTLVTEPPHIRFYAGVALKTPDGIGIGSLCVIDDKPRPQGLTAAQAETLRALARQTMVVMGLRKAMIAREAALTAERREHSVSLLASEAAGERLREAEALMRQAQEAARIGAFEVDIVANQFQVTAEFCRIFGLPQREVFAARELEDLILLPDRATASSRGTRIDASASPDVEYRIRRKSDGDLRWISRRSAFTWDDNGEPIRMLGVVQDITARKQVDLRTTALVLLGDQLRAAATTLEASRIAARLLGETLAASRAGYSMVDEANDIFTVETDWTAPGVASIQGRWTTEPFRATLEELKSGAPVVVANIPAAAWLGTDAAGYASIGVHAEITVPLLRGSALVGVLFVHNATPRTWSAGEIDFAVSVADRTYATIAKLQAEAHQHVLNQELSHRLKNTLSMVQAIATQTLRGVADKSVVETLEARIIALSKAHDVLLQESWSAAPVPVIIGNVLGLSGRLKDINASGPDLTLGPKATLSLAMLLHELTTNSIKYGALSVEIGRIDLTWGIERGDAEPMVAIDWIERGGPPAVAPKRRGFGSRLIGMGLAGAGKAKLDFAETGLHAAFRAPLSSVAEL